MWPLSIEGVLASAPEEGVPVLALDHRARPGEAEDSDFEGQSSESGRANAKLDDAARAVRMGKEFGSLSIGFPRVQGRLALSIEDMPCKGTRRSSATG